MRNKRLGILVVAGAVLLAAVLGYNLLTGRRPLAASVTSAVAAPVDAAGYARADGPRPLSFPADFGAHDDFQSEWWYYTGNLTASTGQHFGYQLTIFRRALVPPGQQVGRPSGWGAEQVYMGHLALTDVSGRKHYAYERYARGAAGLAGAAADPYHVWLDGWSVKAGADGMTRLSAADGDIALSLELRDLKGVVLQGDQGYSRKGPEPGNASYYYSFTRIASQGQVTVNGQGYTVEGLSWMDHEFGTRALSASDVGWNWFSIQLADGRELMLTTIRQANGEPSPFSPGILVEANGATRALALSDTTIEVTGRWRSPHNGAVYPSGWRLRVPSAGLDLAVTPYIPDQEMNLSYIYWEGAVRVEGSGGLSGSGYVELTGYGGSIQGQF